MANLAKNCQRLGKNLNEITRGAPCKVVKSMKMVNLTSGTSPWKEIDNSMTTPMFFFSFHSLAIAAHHSFFKNEPLNCLHKSCTYRAVSNIDSVREPASRHQSQNMKRNQVDQENISAPGGNLIKGKVTKLCMHYYFASFKAERYWVSWCFFQVVWSNKVSN